MKKKPSGDYDSQLRTQKRHKGSNPDQIISVDSHNNQSKPPSHTKKREIKAKDKQKEQLKQPFDEKQNEKNKVAFNNILLNETYTDDEKLEKMAKLITKLQKSAKTPDKWVKQTPLITLDNIEKKLSSKEPTDAEQNPLFIAVRLQNLTLLEKVYEYYQKGYISLPKTQIAHPFLTRDRTHKTLIMVAIDVLTPKKKSSSPPTSKDIKNCQEIIEFILKEEDTANEEQKAQQKKSSINSRDCSHWSFVDRLIEASDNKEIAKIILAPFLTKHLEKIQFKDKVGNPRIPGMINKGDSTEIKQKNMYNRILKLTINNKSLKTALQEPYLKSKLGLTILEEIKEREPQKEKFEQPFDEEQNEDNKAAFNKILLDKNYTDDKKLEKMAKLLAQCDKIIYSSAGESHSSKQPTDAEQNPLFIAVRLQSPKLLKKVYEYYQNGYISMQKIQSTHPFLLRDRTQQPLIMVAITVLQDALKVIDKNSNAKQEAIKNCQEIIEFILKEEDAANAKQNSQQNKSSINAPDKNSCTFFDRLITASENAQIAEIILVPFLTHHLDKIQFTDKNGKPKMLGTTSKRLNTKELNQKTMYNRIVDLAIDNKSRTTALQKPYPNSKLGLTILEEIEARAPKLDSKKEDDDIQKAKSDLVTFNEKHDTNIAFISLINITYSYDKAELQKLMTFLNTGGVIAKIKKVLETLDIKFPTLASIVQSKGKAGFEELITYLNTPDVVVAIKKVLETLDIKFPTLSTIASHKGAPVFKELITYLNTPDVVVAIKKVLETLDIKFTTLVGIASQKGAAGFEELITYLNTPDVVVAIKKVLETLDIPFTTLVGIASHKGAPVFKELITYLNTPDVVVAIKKVLETLDIPFTTLVGIASHKGAPVFKELITYLNTPDVVVAIKKVLETLDIKFTTLVGIASQKGAAVFKELITYLNTPDVVVAIKKVLETLDIPFTTLARIVKSKGKVGLEELITSWHNEVNDPKLSLEGLNIKAESILGLLPSGCQDAVKKYQDFKNIFLEHKAELTFLKTKQINVDNLLKWLCGYKPEQNLEIIKSVLIELKNNKKLPSYSGQELDNWLKKVTETIISTLGFKQKSGDVPPANCDEEQGYDENDPEYEEQEGNENDPIAEEQLGPNEGSVVTTFGKGNYKDTSSIYDNWRDDAAKEDWEMDDTLNNSKLNFIFDNELD